MAPPRVSTVPLLRDIKPADVARDVLELVLNHLAWFAIPLMPGLEVRLLDEKARTDGVTADSLAASTTLGMSAQALAHYAQNGLPTWDWQDHGAASDACLEIFSALYSTAGRPGDIGGGIVDMSIDHEPEDAIEVMLLAALARIKIDQRHALVPRELAVLAGLSVRQVQGLVRAGEIDRLDGEDVSVSAKVAARWLSGRGVPGFAKAAIGERRD